MRKAGKERLPWAGAIGLAVQFCPVWTLDTDDTILSRLLLVFLLGVLDKLDDDDDEAAGHSTSLVANQQHQTTLAKFPTPTQ